MNIRIENIRIYLSHSGIDHQKGTNTHLRSTNGMMVDPHT